MVMIGQINLQWRQSHVSLRRGMEICPIRIVLGRAGGADPVHGLTARIDLRDNSLGSMAAS
jgi:hypothetical protein